MVMKISNLCNRINDLKDLELPHQKPDMTPFSWGKVDELASDFTLPGPKSIGEITPDVIYCFFSGISYNL